MMKKKLLFLMLLFLIVAGGLGIWVYARFLRPERWIRFVKERLEQTIGEPVGIEQIQIVGITGLRLKHLQIPPTDLLPDGQQPWLDSGEALIHFSVLGFLSGFSPAVTMELSEPRILLVEDTPSGWNFRKRARPSSSDSSQTSSLEEKRTRDESVGGKKGRVRLRMKDPRIQVRSLRWGTWSVGVPKNTFLEIQESRTGSMDRFAISGTVEVEGGIPESVVRQWTGFSQNLYRTLYNGRFTADCGFWIGLSRDAWEVASNRSRSLVYEGGSSSCVLDRFRITGGPKSALYSISVERATIELDSWKHPLFSKLEFPWSRVPPGPAKATLASFSYTRDKTRLHAEGLHFSSLSFDPQVLPWLRILEQPEEWRLQNVDLQADFDISNRERQVRWSKGRVTFGEDKEGILMTSGVYRKEPGVYWEVNLSVDRFPVPDQLIDGTRYRLGLLTGETTWGEKQVEGRETPVFFGKGNVELRGGDIGAIRLLAGIEELLDVQHLAETRFQRFAFDFNLAADRVEISHLFLDSPVLKMEGEGVYGPGNRVSVSVKTLPGPELAGAVRSVTAARVVSAVADASTPLQVIIAGDLENPRYRFVAGEGINIPLGDVPLPVSLE